MKLVAIIGDIRNSRKIMDRRSFQYEFIDAVNSINDVYDKFIYSKFVVTLGDEFQGLLLNSEKVIDVIVYIKNRLKNCDLRFGIGVGELSTDVNENISIGADGPVFYAAREAIDYVKKIENKKKIAKKDIYIVNKYNEKNVEDINIIFDNLKVLYDNMNEIQKEDVSNLLVKNMQMKEYIKISNKSQQSLNKSLQRANYYIVKKNFEYINKKIGEI